MSKQRLMMTLSLTYLEVDLIIEALQHRAARHEGMARGNPRSARKHDDKAILMRKLAAHVANEMWQIK